MIVKRAALMGILFHNFMISGYIWMQINITKGPKINLFVFILDEYAGKVINLQALNNSRDTPSTVIYVSCLISIWVGIVMFVILTWWKYITHIPYRCGYTLFDSDYVVWSNLGVFLIKSYYFFGKYLKRSRSDTLSIEKVYKLLFTFIYCSLCVFYRCYFFTLKLPPLG